MKRCPVQGKKPYADYAEALAALDRHAPPGQGRVYWCPSCKALHFTTQVVVHIKPWGRGKARRKPSSPKRRRAA